jgi:hypothetical protein
MRDLVEEMDGVQETEEDRVERSNEAAKDYREREAAKLLRGGSEELDKLLTEFDNAKEYEYWEEGHPIFNMAAHIDKLTKENAGLRQEIINCVKGPTLEEVRGNFEKLFNKTDYSYNEFTNDYNLPDHAANSRYYRLKAYNQDWQLYQEIHGVKKVAETVKPKSEHSLAIHFPSLDEDMEKLSLGVAENKDD